MIEDIQYTSGRGGFYAGNNPRDEEDARLSGSIKSETVKGSGVLFTE